MSRIVTLTLSPALDVATAVPRLYPDAKLRCAPPVYAPGGGGINVARAIQRLGGRALAVFPAGGSTGRHLTDLLSAEGVPSQALKVEQWTRECINLVERSSAQQYRLVMPAARLELDEQEQLLAALLALPRPDYLVVSADTSLGIAAPTVRKRSTVGAGDSMVAALTLKLAAGRQLAEAARYGVAAGTAAIITEGSELCRYADTEQLFAWLQQSAAGAG
ncbi:PfkB family carbohydrate kinase [Pseudomonas sp. EA_105y_Pfl2_R69]|uniref:PfkB family carbohydrate kinase n=1 Tax=Pseudomonas sp. EA_105y_Pfl2_R69 TaxID=3088683 RepID=UPI0030DC21F8